MRFYRLITLFVVLPGFLILSACANKQASNFDQQLPLPSISERLDNADGLMAAREFERAAAVYETVVKEITNDELQKTRDKDRKLNLFQRLKFWSRPDDLFLTDDEQRDALARAYIGQANYELFTRQFFQARKLVTLAEQQNSKGVAVHSQTSEILALILLAEGKLDESRAHLEDLKRQGSDSWRVYNALGVLSDLDQNYHDALAYYDQALEKGGPELQLLNNVGFSLLMGGDYAQAIDTFEQVVRRYPESTRAQGNLALSLARDGSYLEAQKAWAQFIAAELAWQNAAQIALLNQERDKAIEFYKMAIKVAPRFMPSAHRALKQLQNDGS